MDPNIFRGKLGVQIVATAIANSCPSYDRRDLNAELGGRGGDREECEGKGNKRRARERVAS